MSTDGRWDIQLHLVTGVMVEYRVTEETARELIDEQTWDWPPDLTDDERLSAAVYTTLYRRVNKQAGYISATDLDGKLWLIPATAVLAFNVKDRSQPGSVRAIGFTPPTVGEEQPPRGTVDFNPRRSHRQTS